MERARAEFLSYGDSGVSVMEMNPHSPAFEQILHDAQDSLRRLMDIPRNYRILFMQGGATAQFAAVPLNLLSEHRCADYVVTGLYSKQACLEAKKYGDIVIAASSAGALPIFTTIPEVKRSDFRPDADYAHICFNNTVYGTKFHYIPDTGNIPLVADMSSCILSEPVDVSSFGLIYASAQANIAPAGMAVVIVREDLIGNARPDTPSVLNYKLAADYESMYNTPPCWSVYMAKLMFEWIESVGGLEEMKRRNERKASLLYDLLDDKKAFFASPVSRQCRSMTNVVFSSGNPKTDAAFIREAEEIGLLNLSGSPAVGGMRVSLYNAMPYEGVEKLVDFMTQFSNTNPRNPVDF